MELPPPIPLPRLSAEELRDLRFAKALLENPALAARLAGLLGTPIEKGFELLPKGWSASVNRATKLALLKALELAMATMRERRGKNSSEFLHKVLVGASGLRYQMPAAAMMTSAATMTIRRCLVRCIAESRLRGADDAPEAASVRGDHQAAELRFGRRGQDSPCVVGVDALAQVELPPFRDA